MVISLRRLARSATARQAVAFAGASFAANVLAVVSTAILTRNLSTTDFGQYAFSVSLLQFVALFFEFGLFLPAARLAAVDSRHARDVIGAALVAYVPVALAYSTTVFILSFWIDAWFKVDAGSVLRYTSFAALAFPFVFILQQLAQGLDRLHIASAATVGGQLLFVLFLEVALVAGSNLSPETAVLLRASALFVVGALSALWLRPVFRNTARWLRELVREARRWGFQLFIGRVLSIGTYNMDVLLLGVWTNSRSVGLYVLAGSLANASGLPVTAIAASLYSRMANALFLARQWLLTAVAIGALSMIACIALARPVIELFFSSRYEGAVVLVLPLAVAQFVRGITTMYNTFLTSHGRGIELRNAGIVLTASNLIFNFALIPPFGAKGAAWASVIALMANLLAHVVYYRRSVGSGPE